MARTPTSGGLRSTPVGQAWLILLLSTFFGAALAAVEVGLKPRILENKRNATLSQLPSLVPGASARASTEIVMAERPVIAALAEDGKQVGWVVLATGLGFADRIEVLIGFDIDATRITGIYVLEQKETPGLGDFITVEERFRKWFRNQPTGEPLEVVKTRSEPGTGRIMALTGATISSKAVTEIVNLRTLSFRAELEAFRKGDS
jgi:electron transport complex protein RnfG